MLVLAILLFALVEALTEFIPVSSTAHLIALSEILKNFGFNNTNLMEFWQIFIQIGAAFAVIAYFLKDFKSLSKLLDKVLISLVPLVFGFGLYGFIRGVLFHNLVAISIALVVGGIVLILVETLVDKKKLNLHKRLTDVSYKQAFIIGLFQLLAFLPGVSRSGAVIVGMLLLGYKRKDSAEYAFLLGVPTLLGAGGLDLIKHQAIFNGHWTLLSSLLVLALTFLFSLVVIQWFMQYLKSKNLKVFGWYRIVFGLVLLFFIGK